LIYLLFTHALKEALSLIIDVISLYLGQGCNTIDPRHEMVVRRLFEFDICWVAQLKIF